jgi:glycosyltransferase involved in cell wall biosynthesis
LLTTSSLNPNHGGPPVAVSKLAIALRDIGTEVGVLTADKTGIETSAFKAEGVEYFAGSVAGALARFGTPDVIHDHSLWELHHLEIARVSDRRNIPRVVSPFGCLQPETLAISPLKKRVAWLAYQRGLLDRARLIHATSNLEVKAIERLKLSPRVVCIPHGVDLSASKAGSVQEGPQPRIALFLGRIHPKKGLPMLLEAWARTRPANWILEIAGPDEDGHQAQLEEAIRESSLTDQVRFIGPVAGAAKDDAFGRASLFVLPSHSENFGITVAEALAHSVPVLTTNTTPWADLAQRSCGWCVAPDSASIQSALAEATRQPASILNSMGARGREWMGAEFAWPNIARQYISAYQPLLAEADR